MKTPVTAQALLDAANTFLRSSYLVREDRGSALAFIDQLRVVADGFAKGLERDPPDLMLADKLCDMAEMADLLYPWVRQASQFEQAAKRFRKAFRRSKQCL